MSKVVRTNRAYKVDNPIEFVVLVFKVLRWLTKTAIRYRTEVAAGVVVLAVWLLTRHYLGRGPGDYVTLGLVLVVLIAPHTRRLLFGRLRCARTRRYLQAVCRETRVGTTTGRLPLVLSSRRTPAGERYRLFLRPGQSEEQLQGRREELRAALRARDVRISRDSDHAHRITVDCIRRDVLAQQVIESPLVEYIPEVAR